MPGRLRIGLICGTDATRQVVFDRRVGVMLSGNNDAIDVVKRLDPAHFTWTRLHLAESYFAGQVRWNLANIDVLWNLISDADENPAVLAVAERFISESGLPVINPPPRVRASRRHLLAESLAGIPDLEVPRVLRLPYPTPERVRRQAEAAGLAFPVILRRAGLHNQQVMGPFAAPESLPQVVGDDDHYVTEFADVRDPDGLYRRTRFWFIGDQIFRKSLQFQDHWCVGGSDTKAYMRARPDLMAECRRHAAAGFDGQPARTQAALRELRSRVGLDYFGADVGVKPDGRLVLFEANACMNYQPDEPADGDLFQAPPVAEALDAVSRLVWAKAGVGGDAAPASSLEPAG